MNEFERLRRNILNQNKELILFSQGEVNLGFEQGPADTNYIGSIEIGVWSLMVGRQYKYNSIVSEALYDLTPYNEIVIEWQQPEDVGNASCYLGGGLGKDTVNPSWYAIADGQFGRTQQIIDISSVTGSIYIHIGVNSPSVAWVYLLVYKLILR